MIYEKMKRSMKGERFDNVEVIKKNHWRSRRALWKKTSIGPSCNGNGSGKSVLPLKESTLKEIKFCYF